MSMVRSVRVNARVESRLAYHVEHRTARNFVQPERPPRMTPSSEDRDQREPGGPYFGRLLIVLFLAVAFCALLTWALSSYYEN